MIKHSPIFIILLTLLTAGSLSAQLIQSPGTAGATFLKVNMSARSEALAQSFCGLSDDASAVYYNPAGLAQIDNAELQFSSRALPEGMNANSVTYISSKERGTFGVDCRIFQANDTARTMVGGSIVEGTAITIRDLAVSLSYAAEIIKTKSIPNLLGSDDISTKTYNIGFSVKLINETLYTSQVTAFAMDAGILFISNNADNLYGLSIQNVGTTLGKDILPTIVRFGGSSKQEGQVVTWEFCQSIDAATRIGVGVEFLASQTLVLRVGGAYQGDFSYTAGIGLTINGMSVDYTFLPKTTPGFDQTHSMSLRFRFN